LSAQLICSIVIFGVKANRKKIRKSGLGSGCPNGSSPKSCTFQAEPSLTFFKNLGQIRLTFFVILLTSQQINGTIRITLPLAYRYQRQEIWEKLTWRAIAAVLPSWQSV